MSLQKSAQGAGHPRLSGADPWRAPEAWWSIPPAQLFDMLKASANGLPAAEAAQRLESHGPNTIRAREERTPLMLFLGQFKSPLVLILIAAAVVSAVVSEWTDSAIVLAVVLGSTILGFMQEYNAGNAVAALRSRTTAHSTVLRDGKAQSLSSEEVVPGDVVLLSAGSLIPADGIVLEADDLSVNQAALTGETFPVDKRPDVGGSVAAARTIAADSSISERTNAVWMGTNAVSGTARVLVVETGRNTVFGQTAQRLSLREPETEFEHGVARLSLLLTQVMLVIVVLVLTVNVYLKRPLMDSLLFSLALAVGLTPELLPAIISITLSHGARQMAARGVIVRRLNAIENLGSMDVLCTDKTGTLTQGVVNLDGALDPSGEPSPSVLRYAALNARLQTGLSNALDQAIDAYATGAGVDISTESKVGEIPYDFVRKRLSVVSGDSDGLRTLITKGALGPVLDVCANVMGEGGPVTLDPARRAAIEDLSGAAGVKGFRVLGVAVKAVEAQAGAYTREDERDMTFVGTLQFFDPVKADVLQVIGDLARRGVQLKIITGDSQQVACHVAEGVGLPVARVLTGRQLHDLTDDSLWHLADRTSVFAEVDPNQKERIILALRKGLHVVGYMGDGINDAPALHAADVGISVDTAVDVAKEAADFVLLRKDLSVLLEGIDEGRRTFANTLKYVLTTVSANFGNMFSMAGASLLLPFLPLLAPQILLNNFLSDIPSTTIAGDNVDPEWVERPRRWSTSYIRDYMILFGLVSSIFDFATFGVLLYMFKTTEAQFHTGWFVESLLSELVIALVVRTRHLFFRSRPGRLLLVSTLVFCAITLVLPYLPFTRVFGFEPLPAPLLLAVVGLTALYVVVVEVAKKGFYGHLDRAARRGAQRGVHLHARRVAS